MQRVAVLRFPGSNRDLDEFAQFIHRHLLPNPQVSLVRSDIVLKTMKEDQGLPVGG